MHHAHAKRNGGDSTDSVRQEFVLPRQLPEEDGQAHAVSRELQTQSLQAHFESAHGFAEIFRQGSAEHQGDSGDILESS